MELGENSRVTYSKTLTEIINGLDAEIDASCELSIEGRAVFQNISNQMISEVNSRIGSILDQFDMGCLADLLSIPGVDIPGFDFNFSIDSFCEIARDQVLNGSVFALAGEDPQMMERIETVNESILRRHREKQAILDQLGKKDD